MVYMSLKFIVILALLLPVYYLLPRGKRWLALLAASIGFYFAFCKEGILFLLAAALLSFLCARLLAGTKEGGKKKIVLGVGILLTGLPLFLVKGSSFFPEAGQGSFLRLMVPLGISYYTLQMISYLADVYGGEIEAERNLFHYLLYAFYFPQMVQGPIPRFKRLAGQLINGAYFDERMFTKGLLSMGWGFFLKFMIADRAGIVVDTVFGNPSAYRGSYVILGGVLYSFQLYADFQACVCIARGISELFGITLEKNFKQPYFSRSIGEFWRRWHITLSSWLRDYIYIPLGGNRKGTFRKYLNLTIVFAVSGIWHGEGVKFLVWGLMHAFYQIAGLVTGPCRKRIREKLNIAENSRYLVLWQRFVTFVCVMFAWILFRADSLRTGIAMLLSVFTVYNPWIFVDDSIFALGLSWKEFGVLLLSLLTLWKVSSMEEQESVREKILTRSIVTRWLIYIVLVVVIVIFGTYGYGFDTKDFIYGGF